METATFVYVLVWGVCLVAATEFPHCQDAPHSPQRKCLLAMCHHGTCVNVTAETRSGTFTSEECVCDEGWVDFYCDECCRCDPGDICKYKHPGTHQCLPNISRESTTERVVTDTNQSRSEATTDDHPTTTSACPFAVRNETDKCTLFGTSCNNGDCILGNDARGYCECDEGWHGFHCETCCDLPCVHGYCQAVPDKRCACQVGFKGDLCQFAKPTPTGPPVISPWTWYIVGIAGLLVLIMLVVTCCVLWRKRIAYIPVPREDEVS